MHATKTIDIPALRMGAPYESVGGAEVRDHRTGEVVARVSQTNAGLVRRDLKRLAEGQPPFEGFVVADLLERCPRAGEIFMEDALPLGAAGALQTPADYVEALGATSGFPAPLARRNMEKIATVFAQMPAIIAGLTRGLDLRALDGGLAGLRYAPTAHSLGVVLPSNSPGVNSIWMPACVLRVPVVLKPGRDEPWTPWRIVQSFIAAGFPASAFGFYPTDHEGAAAILELCGRSLLFGDEATTAPWRANPRVEVHGPGRSKIVIGPDQIDRWPDFLDVMVSSVLDNGGRSCINASTIVVPSRANEIAAALAQRLAPIEPASLDDERAQLCAFTNPAIARAIDAAIERGLESPGGATDVTASLREGRRRERLVEHARSTYLRPTVVRAPSLDHPLGNTEYLFPFVAVVETDAGALPSALGASLVVSLITKDRALAGRFLSDPFIDRLNIGPVPTSRIDWTQPHEGNLFELLYRRRAIVREAGW